jgi:hypothetical protein
VSGSLDLAESQMFKKGFACVLSAKMRESFGLFAVHQKAKIILSESFYNREKSTIKPGWLVNTEEERLKKDSNNSKPTIQSQRQSQRLRR